jgi:hypothetical protein
MSSNTHPPISRRDDIALQFMRAMARDTALTPDAMATRAFALADAFEARSTKALTDAERIFQRVLRPTSSGDSAEFVQAPTPKQVDEIPF